LHLLWLKRYEIVHCTLDGETQVNDVIELRQEVSDILQEPEYLLFLPLHMLSIDPNSMDPPDLRAWLFEIYILCEDYETCENLNNKVRVSYNYV